MAYSYSQLDTFQKCQKQYMYEYVHKEKRKFFNVVLEGTIVHKFLELLWGHTWEDTTDLVIQQYGMYDKIKEIQEYLQRIIPADFFKNTLECEYQINFDVMGMQFKGFIDRLDKKEQTFEIIDYKYGAYEYNAWNLVNSLQVDLYCYAIMQQFHVDAVYFTYHNVKQNTMVTRYVKKQSINASNIVALIKAIENAKTTNYFPPQVSSLCSYCFFNNVCEDYKTWLYNEYKLTPDSTLDDIIEVISSFGNKRRIYESSEKKLKQFTHNWMQAQGLREYKGKQKQLILNKDSVLIKG